MYREVQNKIILCAVSQLSGEMTDAGNDWYVHNCSGSGTGNPRFDFMWASPQRLPFKPPLSPG
jgi:hypothetical protein